MATCPFAVWKQFASSPGPYIGGPHKIVHHTTESSKAQSAFDQYAKEGNIPHFTVDDTTVYQHLDTGVSARSLANPKGGVHTNKQSAVQIEVVGFAGKPKSRPTLLLVARLCRWIEAMHVIPNTWPSGSVKPARNGSDPGGHNRDAANWVTRGGHYGHSQVPENIHWDPAYSEIESELIRTATFSADGALQDAGNAVKMWLFAEMDVEDAPFTPIEDHGIISPEERD